MSFSPQDPLISGLTVRAMSADDTDARKTALLKNLNRFEQRFGEQDCASEPLRNYLSFDPARGDIGLLLANDAGETVGMMWVAFIKGFGFINASVPELTLYLAEEWHGKGVGQWMLDQAEEYGRVHGWPGIAVNVEKESPARRLYARCDYVTQDGGSVAGSVMLKTLSPKIRSVAVYCGSAHGARPEYTAAARALGTALAERGITMVYGGGKLGLMGETADAAIAAGGEVHGVMPQNLVDLEQAHPRLTRLEITESIAERKTRMEDLADAFVVLPGGMGTMEEMFEVLVCQQLGPYCGPVALFNVEEYWEPLVKAFQAMSEEGFIAQRYIDALVVAGNTDELFEGFASWVNPGLKWN